MESFCFRILVVDDYEPFRRFIGSTLSNQARMRIIGEASDGLEAVQKAQDLRPDLILLDIGLPTFNGIDAARRIFDLLPDTKMLFVSQQSSRDLVQAALNAGALGYVVKTDAARELLPAVETVLRGKAFVSSSLIGGGLTNSEDEHHARRGKVVSRFPMQKGVASRRHKHCPDDAAFVDDFAHAIEGALENGNAVLVVTTESHRANVLQQLRADGVNIDTAADRNFFISIDVPDSAVVDTMSDEDGCPKGVRNAIVEALRAAKEKHLPLSVG